MSNPSADRVKDVAQLSGRSARSRRGLFLAEGPQTVKEALKLDRTRCGSGKVVVEIYATAASVKRDPELLELLNGVPWRAASDEVLAAMADTVNPQGVVAVCHKVDVSLQSVLDRQPRLIAVMCRVQDPGNAGTILRAADSAGADAIILTSGSVDIYNPKAVRSTVGSLFHLPVVVGQDFNVLVAQAGQIGLVSLAADGYGSEDLDTLQDESAERYYKAHGIRAAEIAMPQNSRVDAARPRLEDPSFWLFGNEAKGLNGEELGASRFRVAVPLYGRAESLNVGTAATVCLYASARAQRR
ncbi:TrmH family RNA methyltransferase [Arthrobacter roseus]|nr:TrmH family RNA methyltransferase [Arthrobacter roseus]